MTLGSATGTAGVARDARVAGAAARRYGAWFVAEHRLRGMRSYAGTVLATGIGNPLVYLFALGVGLASIVDANLGADAVDGTSYLVFVAPALLATAAVTVATEEFTYPIFGGFKWNPIFFAMNAAPVSPRQIIDGQIIAVAIRMVPTCAIYFGFMLLFGAVPSPLGWLSIFVAVLTGMAVGAVLMSYTATLETDTGQLAMVMRFGITPMFLFSGTFFPLTQLPVALQWIGWISPLWHGTELGRVVSYGSTEPAWLTVAHVLYLVAWLAVGWGLSRRTAARRLNK